MKHEAEEQSQEWVYGASTHLLYDMGGKVKIGYTGGRAGVKGGRSE